MNNYVSDISVVIPARNEAGTIEELVNELLQLKMVREVIVIDDGSTDDTGELAAAAGAVVKRNNKSKGNGSAIKSGAKLASSDWLVFMDGDGQHQSTDISLLVERAEITECDMVVGSRSRSGQANQARFIANSFYNWFASLVTGERILDLTSGFRLVRRLCFLRFLHLLPQKFSYPTTITMSFLRAGFDVEFQSVDVLKSKSESKINPLTDGFKFLIIIFKVATLYSPLKVFIPIAMFHIVAGLARYAWTYSTMGTFTNMSALLLVTGVLIFLIGLVSEQISTLIYKETEKEL